MKQCELESGDIIDKAAILLKEIVKNHVFASGNRRTALLATLVFCRINGHNIYISDKPTDSKVLTGIREDYYSMNEIKKWLKNGKIRKFKR